MSEFWEGALAGFGFGVLLVFFVMVPIWARSVDRARAEERNQAIADFEKAKGRT